MEILIGLLIIAIGVFCQSSSYVPINKIKKWSWETYWLVQGLFAWVIFPTMGTLLAVPAGRSLFELLNSGLAGLMSACFNIGLEFGGGLNFDGTEEIYRTLPATLIVTSGGFVTNLVYRLYQNQKNHTWGDYSNGKVWANNLLFYALAGVLWYSRFFGLSLGKGFLSSSPVLTTFAFCILMALNVTFSNIWGIILKEWKGCSRKTIVVLITGIIILIVSTFVPELMK